MKQLAFLLLISFSLGLSACSTCYECESDVVLTDGNNNPIDTTQNTEEFCTADASEVEAKEDEGADCRIQ